MTTPARVPGKRGKLPVKPPAERFPIQYVTSYLHAPLPSARYPVDVTGEIGTHDWGMLGNDQYGDCGYAGREHYRMAKAACYGITEKWETADELVAEYLKYNHGRDVGVNLADVLLYWYKQGKIKAFAPVDHTDPAQMDAAMQAFKGLYVGVGLTDDADELFSDNKPWTVAQGQRSDPSEGHCIVKVKADGHKLDGYVTWGALQKATRGWSADCVEEAWVAITNEDEAAKVDMAALTADIDALHGTGPAKNGAAPDQPQSLNSTVISVIRTAVPVAVGAVLAWLASKGLNLGPAVEAPVVAALTWGISTGYYSLVRLGETRWPWLGVLLGDTAVPVYVKPSKA